MKTITITRGTAGLLAGIALAAAGSTEFPDRLYLGLRSEISGPVRVEGQTPIEARAYRDAILRQTLRSATRLGADLAGWDEVFFATWLTQAMVVVEHESHGIHFRQIRSNSERCLAPLHSGQLHRRKSARLGDLFTQHLAPAVLSCSSWRTRGAVSQLLTSHDLESVGLLQLALRWHVAEYTEPQTFLSVDGTLDYGLSYLHRAFRSLLRHSDRYECLSRLNPSSVEFRKNLVRGAWAGGFNSGSVQKSCRFEHPEDPWHANDERFLVTLNSFLAAPEGQGEYSPALARIRSRILQTFIAGTDPAGGGLLKAVQSL